MPFSVVDIQKSFSLLSSVSLCGSFLVFVRDSKLLGMLMENSQKSYR